VFCISPGWEDVSSILIEDAALILVSCRNSAAAALFSEAPKSGSVSSIGRLISICLEL
tara:strand:- start:175 stop:348 length:174 start_codon:yes stop_codon:yes gene_type:complete